MRAIFLLTLLALAACTTTGSHPPPTIHCPPGTHLVTGPGGIPLCKLL